MYGVKVDETVAGTRGNAGGRARQGRLSSSPGSRGYGGSEPSTELILIKGPVILESS